MNSNFLKQIEEENRILEQELQNLLNQKRQKVEKEFEDPEDACPNFRSEKGDLSKIDEETDEEQPNYIEPQRLIESPQKLDSILDNSQDSIGIYLEKRSSSTRETLKFLEREVKEKNAQIQALQIDLAKKQKYIDFLEKNGQKQKTPSNKEANCEGQQQIQKQCKEWEKKYFECNSQLKENKKYAQKLQELNQQLLHKLKQFEFNTELNQQKNVNNEIYEANTNVLIKYEQIIKTQQEQIQQQEDRYIALESKYDKLKENSEQFLFNSRDLKYQYEHMLNTLESIANSY
ncbi:unnamed protein product [Paramecium sonneborni]|uniref:Uncharacterized protein n=1 Tax=Paramecium sonneborni TaxID=65129 RepID=A0A8S1KV63_9CILI|nr:unnamed protein product [Paramecium sonneborni]